MFFTAYSSSLSRGLFFLFFPFDACILIIILSLKFLRRELDVSSSAEPSILILMSFAWYYYHYMILYSSETPKQVKNYPFRRLVRGILCYHRFAKKGTMYKQSQEQQCWIWVEWSQELHNTQSFLPPVSIRTMQSLFSKMAFTASCLPWNLKYSNTIIFLKKCLGQCLLSC